jgi:hypothetical protein
MRLLMAVSIVGIAMAGCSGSKPGGAKDQPGPGAGGAEAEKKAAAANAAVEARRNEKKVLTSHDWIAGKGEAAGFIEVGTDFRFSEDGKVTDWLRSSELGTFEIDPGQSPKQIDLTIGGETRRGVYETVTGDRPEIRLCVPARKDGPRPTKVEDPWRGSDPEAARERAKHVCYIVLEPVMGSK